MSLFTIKPGHLLPITFCWNKEKPQILWAIFYLFRKSLTNECIMYMSTMTDWLSFYRAFIVFEMDWYQGQTILPPHKPGKQIPFKLKAIPGFISWSLYFAHSLFPIIIVRHVYSYICSFSFTLFNIHDKRTKFKSMRKRCVPYIIDFYHNHQNCSH